MPIGVNTPLTDPKKKLGVVPPINPVSKTNYAASQPVSASVASVVAKPGSVGVAGPNAAISKSAPASISGATALPGGGYAPTYVEQSTTNYGGKNNPLNEILYSKKQYDAGNKSWAANNAQQYYGQLDPTEAAAVKEMNTQQLIDYINQKNTPQTTTTTDTGTGAVALDGGGYMPPPPTAADPVYNTQTGAQLQQQSGDGLAIERAALKNAIDTQIASLRNSADYSNQLLQDNRALADAQFGRSVNPFSGRKGYLQAQTERGRAIDDNQRMGELNNQFNALSTEMANFDKLAPERQRQIFNELLALERQFAINQSGVTGQYGGRDTLAAKIANDQSQQGWAGLSGNLPGGGQTLQGKQLNWNMDPNNPQNQGQVLSNQGQQIANQLAQLQVDNYPETVRQQAALFEQQFKSGQIDIDTATYQLEQLKDPKSVLNRTAALELQMKELEAKNLPEMQRLQLQQLKKSISQIGKVQPKSQYELDMQKINLQTAQAEYDKLINESRTPPKTTLTPKESTDNYNMIYDDISSGATKEEARTLLQSNSANLTDADYKKLNDLINDNY